MSDSQQNVPPSTSQLGGDLRVLFMNIASIVGAFGFAKMAGVFTILAMNAGAVGAGVGSGIAIFLFVYNRLRVGELKKQAVANSGTAPIATGTLP